MICRETLTHRQAAGRRFPHAPVDRRRHVHDFNQRPTTRPVNSRLIEMLIPPGGGPPPHRHDFEETFSVLEGAIEVTFRGQKANARRRPDREYPGQRAALVQERVRRHDTAASALCAPAGQDEFFKLRRRCRAVAHLAAAEVERRGEGGSREEGRWNWQISTRRRCCRRNKSEASQRQGLPRSLWGLCTKTPAKVQAARRSRRKLAVSLVAFALQNAGCEHRAPEKRAKKTLIAEIRNPDFACARSMHLPHFSDRKKARIWRPRLARGTTPDRARRSRKRDRNHHGHRPARGVQ